MCVCVCVCVCARAGVCVCERNFINFKVWVTSLSFLLLFIYFFVHTWILFWSQLGQLISDGIKISLNKQPHQFMAECHELSAIATTNFCCKITNYSTAHTHTHTHTHIYIYIYILQYAHVYIYIIISICV